MIIDFDSKNKGGGGKEPVVEALNVTANGTYTAPSGVDGYNPVEVNVPQKTFNKTSLTKEYTENGQYSIATPDGYDGISDVSVTVNVASSGGTGFDTTQLSQLQFRQNLYTVDLTGLDTRNVSSMKNMFYYCASKTLDLSNLNTSNVQDFNGMFSYSSLTTLDLSNFDTSRANSFSNMFNYCTQLTSLNISNWNMSRGQYIYAMFEVCRKLTTIISDGLKLPDANMNNIALDWCPLTVDSIVGLLNALPQSTNGYSFQIGQTNIDKLSDDQKAIATNKGWTLV